MRLKKSFGLLMILLVVPLAFAGITRSTAAATLSLSPMSGGVYASGNGWTPNTGVAFYFDYFSPFSTDHLVTSAKASATGSFSFVAIPIGNNIALGSHKIIAVQGDSKMATAVYTPSSVAPPDDRLLDPIQEIHAALTGDIENKLDDIRDTLASDGDFYTFVDDWFTGINDRLDYTNGALATIEERVNTLYADRWIRLFSRSGTRDTVLQGIGSIITVETSLAAEYIVSIHGHLEDSLSEVYFIYRQTDGFAVRGGEVVGEDGVSVGQTFTVIGTGVQIFYANADDGDFLRASWSIIVKGVPGTQVTVTNS